MILSVCTKLFEFKFRQIFSNLITGKGYLLQFCKANYVSGHCDVRRASFIVKPFVQIDHSKATPYLSCFECLPTYYFINVY